MVTKSTFFDRSSLNGVGQNWIEIVSSSVSKILETNLTIKVKHEIYDKSISFQSKSELTRKIKQ